MKKKKRRYISHEKRKRGENKCSLSKYYEQTEGKKIARKSYIYIHGWRYYNDTAARAFPHCCRRRRRKIIILFYYYNNNGVVYIIIIYYVAVIARAVPRSVAANWTAARVITRAHNLYKYKGMRRRFEKSEVG